jgi:hypothetical protein
MIAFAMADKAAVPTPSPRKRGQKLVPAPLWIVAKLALCWAPIRTGPPSPGARDRGAPHVGPQPRHQARKAPSGARSAWKASGHGLRRRRVPRRVPSVPVASINRAPGKHRPPKRSPRESELRTHLCGPMERSDVRFRLPAGFRREAPFPDGTPVVLRYREPREDPLSIGSTRPSPHLEPGPPPIASDSPH